MGELHLSENIIRLRRKRGITQEGLAEFLGITKASVSKWETGQSMPDILLLPRLAGYFDVSLDELLGYDPQLSREQIRTYYHELAASFAREPFEKAMGESQVLVKKYYSCYPFLVQICTLWLNHFMMAEKKERRKEILSQISEICDRILEKCRDLVVCENASSIKSVANLYNGKAGEVAESLEDILNVNNIGAKGTLLVQAYLSMGDLERADRAAQVNLYRSVMEVLSSGLQLVQIHGKDRERCMDVINHMDCLIRDFSLEELNPNSVAGYEYQVGILCCGWQQEDEAYHRLEHYGAAVKKLFENGLRLTGNELFPRIGEWLEGLELGGVKVRDRSLIRRSVLEAFDHPAFGRLPDKNRLAQIRKTVEKVCGGREKCDA